MNIKKFTGSLLTTQSDSRCDRRPVADGAGSDLGCRALSSSGSNEECRRICRFGDRHASGYHRPIRDRGCLRSPDGGSPSPNESSARDPSRCHSWWGSCRLRDWRYGVSAALAGQHARFQSRGGHPPPAAIDRADFAHPSGLSALTTGEEREAELSDEIAVFPLAIPLIAGPASITAAMLLMGQSRR